MAAMVIEANEIKEVQASFILPVSNDMKKKIRLVTFMFIVTLLLTGVAAPALATQGSSVTFFPGEIELAGSVRQREAVVAAKEKELAERESLVRELENELEDKFERLTALQKDLQDTLAEIQKTEDAHFRSLVRVYSSMKATQVAAILNEMEDDAAVRILKALKTDMAAQIMPKLDRGKAVRVSKQLGMIE
jgi:flagellar motility protein MotE (MotC chaperone)